ncbi:MAG: hypothetical protein Q7U02_08510 [Desulfosalsimonadaceae bacterium]|nr:hypothetical protein [Desulfosalsimonadaceae bacterium]
MIIRKVIAGVELIIRSLPDVKILEKNPASEIFLAPENLMANDQQIHVQLSEEPLPLVEEETLLFRAGSLWSIHRDNRFYWIVLHPPSLPAPLWIARFDHTFSQGIVYCSEHLKHTQNGKAILSNPVSYPLDQILLMHFLAKNGGMLVHATGWLYHRSGWIFAGKSGAGKSTLSNLIVKATGSRFLSDDRIIIRKVGHGFFMYGTPWPGEAGYALNQAAPLKGMFFLNKGDKNNIRELKTSEAIAGLMPVVSIPWYDREKVDLMMSFCDDVIGNVPMYELTFVPDESIVDVLARFVNQ